MFQSFHHKSWGYPENIFEEILNPWIVLPFKSFEQNKFTKLYFSLSNKKYKAQTLARPFHY